MVYHINDQKTGIYIICPLLTFITFSTADPSHLLSVIPIEPTVYSLKPRELMTHSLKQKSSAMPAVLSSWELQKYHL